MSQSDSTICPRCKRLIFKNEASCPFCGMKRPGAWWNRNFIAPDLLLKTIIGINILMYAVSMFLYPIQGGFSNPLTALAPNSKSLVLLGATGTIPLDQMGHWWALIAASYLHGGILHILFNMAAFRQIGGFVTRAYGVHRFIILYTVCGVGGFLASYGAGTRLSIGASAAICGLIGAALYYGKTRGGEFGEAVFRQTGTWVIAIFVLGILVPGIDNWGHGGGLLSGILLGLLLGYNERSGENLFHRLLAWLCILLTAGVLAWSLFFALSHRLGG